MILVNNEIREVLGQEEKDWLFESEIHEYPNGWERIEADAIQE